MSDYNERTAQAFDEIVESLQNDSNFACDYSRADFEEMALANARELTQLAAEPPSPELLERRLDCARRLATVAVHLMVLR